VSTLAATGIALLLAATCLAGALVLPSAASLWLSLERARSRLALHRVHVAGFEMPYLEGGRGPVLLLVHGFGGDKDNFTRVARFLVPYFRVVIPDLPGFGDASRDAAASYDIASQVARLHAFVAALGLGQAHLGGNSMGGFIAAQYAATHPDDVVTLWLLDAAGFDGAFDTDVIRRYAATGESVLLLRSVASFDALMATATHRRPWLPPALRRALAARGIRDRTLHERIFREIGVGSPTLESISSAIRAPTLIVWGRQDRILNPDVAASMHARIAGSELSMMEDTGHLPMVERPGRSAGDYRRFVARHVSAPGAAPRV